MEIYSVDSTESREKQQKIQEQNIAPSGIRSEAPKTFHPNTLTN